MTLRGSARVCLTFYTVSMAGSAMDRCETVITLTYTRETRTSYGTRILVSISAAHFADDIIIRILIPLDNSILHSELRQVCRDASDCSRRPLRLCRRQWLRSPNHPARQVPSRHAFVAHDNTLQKENASLSFLSAFAMLVPSLVK